MEIYFILNIKFMEMFKKLKIECSTKFIKQFMIIESHCRYLTEFYFTDSTRYGIILNFIQHHFINSNLRNLCTIEDGFVIRNILFNQIHYFEENYSIPSRISKIKLSQICSTKGKLKNNVHKVMQYHSAGKHDRGPLFFTLFSFRIIRSRSTGSI